MTNQRERMSDPKPLTREEVERLLKRITVASSEPGVAIYTDEKGFLERLCADWLRMETRLEDAWNQFAIDALKAELREKGESVQGLMTVNIGFMDDLRELEAEVARLRERECYGDFDGCSCAYHGQHDALSDGKDGE